MIWEYHNEHDPYSAQWTRNLMSKGLIPDGFVDERDVRDVQPMDLWGYSRWHFFSGIAGWAYALRLAGVPDDYPGVWTGSCPCQPFSAAGRGKGFADERHLWPAWFQLIREYRPAIVFGENVEAAVRHRWLDVVFSDLEGCGYACGAAVLPAAGVGAPQARARIYWLAHANDQGLSRPLDQRRGLRGVLGPASAERGNGSLSPWLYDCANPDSIVADHGLRRPVGQVRGFGNAIVPQVAAAFIEAALACRL